MEEIRQIKENWYMAKWKEQTPNSKIQLILEIKGTYLFMVSDWLTNEEIENIDLTQWNFMKWTSWEQQKAGVNNDNNN